MARYIINPDGESCEFVLVVADAWQHKGISHRLMNALMDVARNKGLRQMEGTVAADNRTMLNLVATLGFRVDAGGDASSPRQVVKYF